MPCDKFWAVAAKKRTWLRWCCFYLFAVAGDGAGCGVGKAVLGRVFVRPRPDELMDGAFFVRRAG